MTHSGSDRDHANAALVVLRRRVDAHFDAAVARSPTAFRCQAGCFDCCRAGLSVFAIEADRIAIALAALPDATRRTVRAQAADAERTHCALLVDGLCSVYAQRPILCRSHGLAVRVPATAAPAGDAGQDAATLSHCPLNYQGQTPPAPSVLNLDAVNQPLAVMAGMWGGQRVTLAALASRSD